MIINCLKNVPSLVRGRSCFVCDWRGEVEPQGPMLHSFSVCPMSHSFMAHINPWAFIKCQKLGTIQGTRENETRAGLSGTTFLVRKTIQKHETPVLIFAVYSEGALLIAPWPGGSTTLVLL